MKVYLHDDRRNRYYAGSNKWVTDADQGLDFENIEEALRARDEQDLSATDLLVFDGNPTRAVRLTASRRHLQ